MLCIKNVLNVPHIVGHIYKCKYNTKGWHDISYYETSFLDNCNLINSLNMKVFHTADQRHANNSSGDRLSSWEGQPCLALSLTVLRLVAPLLFRRFLQTSASVTLFCHKLPL